MENYSINVFSKKILSGKIKEKPEDFIVEEITPNKKICSTNYSLFEIIKDSLPKEKKEQLHFTLVKKNWTTLRAISELSKRLRISRRRFGYAGTKDKRAITSQRVSVWNVDIEKLKKIKMKDIILKNFEYSNKRISLGDLYGNRFTITIRNAKIKNLNKINEALKEGVPNFFGPQRFGIQRHLNHLIGKQLLLGNFEGAAMILVTNLGNEDATYSSARKFAADNWGNWKEILKILPKTLGIEAAIVNYLVTYPNDYANAIRKLPKKLRRMFIHAYQSWIFNKTLSEVITRKIDAEEIPLVGYETKLSGEVGEIIKKILKEENIKLSDFKLKRMPELSESGSSRKTKVYVEDFKILKRGKDFVKLRFALPKGVYATTVLSYLGVEI